MRFTSGNGPQLSCFPRDGHPWRIDWFGDVSFPDKRQSYRHPSIVLAISRLGQSSLGQLTPNGSAGNRREVWVPVGLLSRLRIGDIWQDGRLISQDEAPQTIFQNLTVNSQTSRVVKAGIELKGRWFMLPAKDHPGHMQHTQSHCMLIHLEEEKQMVIPCAELARFYFGSSNWLLEKLFLPPLNPRTLFLTADFKPEGGRLHLKLPFQVSGFSASDIGRIARDKSARRAATQIGESLLTNTTQKEKAYPKALFPFVGTTDLSVKGQWLPLGRKPEMTFLVHSIQSCTHAFPFQKLTYQLDRLQDGPSMRARQPKKQTNPSPLTHSKVVSATSSIANKDPSARMSPGMWFENQGIKFPDLITKEVFRIRPLKNIAVPEGRAFRPRNGGPVTFAVGSTSGTHQPVHPLAVAVTPPTYDWSAAPEFLRDFLQKLAKISDIHFFILTESHFDGWSVPINTLQGDDREVSRQLYVQDKKIERLRRACALALQTHDNKAIGTLVLMENLPLAARFFDAAKYESLDLEAALEASALQFVVGQTLPIKIVLQTISGLSER